MCSYSILLWTMVYGLAYLPGLHLPGLVERQHRFAHSFYQALVGGIVGLGRHQGTVAEAENEALAYLTDQFVRLQEAPKEAMALAAADQKRSLVPLVIVVKLKGLHGSLKFGGPGAQVSLTPIRYNN